MNATATTPQTDLNSTQARPEPIAEWPEGDLPEQGGSPRSTLLPGVYSLQLPQNLAQCWHDITVNDKRKFLGNGQPNPTYGQPIARRQLKLDRNNPLIVVGGAFDGDAVTANFSTAPRARSMKKGASEDPATPWIADAAYLLDISLNDKSRPTDPKELEAAINRGAGKVIRLEYGLTGQCRPDKARYLRIALPDGSTQDLVDPTGTKGCGARYYTKQFKNPAAGQPGEPAYETEISCSCGDQPTPAQQQTGAVAGTTVVIRAFEQVERFLPPAGV